MLSIFINVLLAIHVLVSLLIILLVLMQRPKNEGLGAAFGGGMTENLFGAQTTNVLQTFTRYLGALFFGLTLLLSYLYVKQTMQHSSVHQRLLAPTVVPPAPTTPAPDDKLTGEMKRTIEEAIRKGGGTPPPGPAPEPAPEAEKKPAGEAKPAPAPAAPVPDAPKPETPAPVPAKPDATTPPAAPAPAAEKPATPPPAPVTPDTEKPTPPPAPAPAPAAEKPAVPPAEPPATPEKAPEKPGN